MSGNIRLSDTVLVFPSLANDGLWYEIHNTTQVEFNSRPAGLISEYLVCWRDEGDTGVQHSAATPVQLHNLIDVINSLYACLFLLPTDRVLDCLDCFFRCSTVEPELLQWAWKLQYDYPLYLNLSERKKSKADGKRHDKRWVQADRYFVPENGAAWSKRIECLFYLLNLQESPCRAYNVIGRLEQYRVATDALNISDSDAAKSLKEYGDTFLDDADDNDLRNMLIRYARIVSWFKAVSQVQWVLRQSDNYFKEHATDGTVRSATHV